MLTAIQVLVVLPVVALCLPPLAGHKPPVVATKQNDSTKKAAKRNRTRMLAQFFRWVLEMRSAWLTKDGETPLEAQIWMRIRWLALNGPTTLGVSRAAPTTLNETIGVLWQVPWEEAGLELRSDTCNCATPKRVGAAPEADAGAHSRFIALSERRGVP